MSSISISRRFCGPPTSGNGGYTAGVLAQHLGGTAEVTLRQPPPLDRPLRIDTDDSGARLLDGDQLVASATTAVVDVAPPIPIPYDAAVGSSMASPFLNTDTHPFPTCFVCGPSREPGDGLRIFAGRVSPTESFAAPWTPTEVDELIVWAALDCPSCAPIYLDTNHPAPFVLGRFAVRIDELPRAGDPHVIMSWQLAREGRKLFSASALYSPDGDLCAIARATWIQLAT